MKSEPNNSELFNKIINVLDDRLAALNELRKHYTSHEKECAYVDARIHEVNYIRAKLNKILFS